MFFPTAELASGVPQVLQSQRSPISDPISADPICTGERAAGENFAISEPESDNFEQISAKSRVSPRQWARGPDFLADFLIGKIANPSLVF